MTSRERVRAVLNHQLPDRVPNGLGCETEGLHVVAYDNLQKLLCVALSVLCSRRKENELFLQAVVVPSLKSDRDVGVD